MTKLKLSAIPDDRPVKITVELPADVFRDLQAYAAILAKASRETTTPDPAKLVAPMLQRFMAFDKGSKRSGICHHDRKVEAEPVPIIACLSECGYVPPSVLMSFLKR